MLFFESRPSAPNSARIVASAIDTSAVTIVTQTPVTMNLKFVRIQSMSKLDR